MSRQEIIGMKYNWVSMRAHERERQKEREILQIPSCSREKESRTRVESCLIRRKVWCVKIICHACITRNTTYARHQTNCIIHKSINISVLKEYVTKCSLTSLHLWNIHLVLILILTKHRIYLDFDHKDFVLKTCSEAVHTYMKHA